MQIYQSQLKEGPELE